MTIAECRLAAEKEMDGKPFTVCEVGTWFVVEIALLKETPDVLERNASKLYDEFHNGKDKTERGATLEELKELPSNGGIYIIPKTKDRFIKADDWS